MLRLMQAVRKKDRERRSLGGGLYFLTITKNLGIAFFSTKVDYRIRFVGWLDFSGWI
jgi:hypothetical protein